MSERIINLGEASGLNLNGDYVMIDSESAGARKLKLADLAVKVSVTQFTRRSFNVSNSSISTITITEGE